MKHSDYLPSIYHGSSPSPFAFADNSSAAERAAADGLEMVVPDERTITVDFDMPQVPSNLEAKFRFLEKFYPIRRSWQTTSKSGNIHLYMEMEQTFTDTEKVAIQAILGSDWKRELLNLVRAKEGNLGFPSLLFEVPKKEAA